MGGTKWNCEVTKVPMLEHESSLISIGCIAFWRRLPDWAVLEAYWGIQDAHHNKMLMEDTKHCADRISIRGLLTVKEGEGWSQRALIPPASLSTLGVGGGGFPWWGGCGGLGPMASWAPWQVQYLHLLDHISAPSMRGSVPVAGWRSMAQRSAGLGPALQADLTAPHWNIHKVLAAWRRWDTGRHLIHSWSPLHELDPKLLLNQGECDNPTHTAHQPTAPGLWRDLSGFCRSCPLTGSLLGGSARNA